MRLKDYDEKAGKRVWLSEYYSRVGWLGMVMGVGLGFALGALGSYAALAVFVVLVGGTVAVEMVAATEAPK